MGSLSMLKRKSLNPCVLDNMTQRPYIGTIGSTGEGL